MPSDVKSPSTDAEIDARSNRLDTTKVSELGDALKEVLSDTDGMSGADIRDALMSGLSALEAKLSVPDALFFSRLLSKAVKSHGDALSNILLNQVNSAPGSYEGFSVVSSTGRPSVDMDKLAQFQDVFNVVVTPGKPYTFVRTN